MPGTEGSTIIALETDRLTIRAFRPDDWPDLLDLAVRYQATDAAKYDDPWPTSEEGVKGMASFFASGDEFLAACLKSTGKVIGMVAINRRRELEGSVHNLGYVFHPDYHGMGYATEACRTAMAHIFGVLGADKILTGTHDENVASIRLLARLGIHKTDTGRDAYSLSREDWVRRQQASET